jgi:replication factor C small subunit
MFNTREHTIWVEKYRPDTLEGYIGNEQLKVKLAQFIKDADVPHVLLVGPAGTGKTTAAKILVNNIDCDSLIINASDENNIETVRTKIRGFASSMGFRPLKLMVLDEFDYFTQAGQAALRNLMEQFSQSTRFILTANYIERIIDPIISRTQMFHVVPPSMKEAALHIATILRKEKVEFAPADLKILLDAHFPDIRKVLNECQNNSRAGKLVIDKAAVINGDFKLKLVEELKSAKKPKDKFSIIRQLLADSQVRDYTDIYRLLFDHVTEIAPGNISAAILAIAEGSFRDSQVVDKEITMMATLVNILQVMA